MVTSGGGVIGGELTERVQAKEAIHKAAKESMIGVVFMVSFQDPLPFQDVIGSLFIPHFNHNTL